MCGSRGELASLLGEHLDAGGSVVLHGELGSGRRALLDRFAPHASNTREGLAVLRACADRSSVGVTDGTEVLSDAIGVEVGPSASADALHELLAGGLLVVEELQWLGPVGTDLVVTSIEAGRQVIVTVAEDVEGWQPLVARCSAAGAQPLALGPLHPAEAAAHIEGAHAGWDASTRRDARLGAGGNLSLLSVRTSSEMAAAQRESVRSRAATLDPPSRDALALLALAEGRVPASVLEADVAASLARRGWIETVDRQATGSASGDPAADTSAIGSEVVLSAGLLAEEVLNHADPAERARWHRRLADHLDGARTVRHLAAAGDPTAAVKAALAMLGEPASLEPEDELVALDVIERYGGELAGEVSGSDLTRRRCAALLDAGRTEEALSLANAPAGVGDAFGDGGDDGRSARDLAYPDLVVTGLRRTGRPVEALELATAALAGACDEVADALTAEVDLLALWPGLEPDPKGAGPAHRSPAGGLPTLPTRIREAQVLGEVGAAVAALAATDARGARDRARAASQADPLRPNAPWSLLGSAVHASVDLHLGHAPAGVADLLATFGSRAHAAPGVAAGHLAVALADQGRAPDGLALVAEARAAAVAPVGWDELVLRWAEASCELAAGRPRRALRTVEAMQDVAARATVEPPVLIAAAITQLRIWTAVELAEPDLLPDDPRSAHAAVPVVEAVTAELDGARLLLTEGSELDAVEVFESAVQRWGPARCARRTRWAMAEAHRLAGADAAATALLRELEEEAAGMGLLPLLSRVRQSLRRLGLRAARLPTVTSMPGSKGSSPPASAPIAGLSPREVAVMELVSEGLSSTAAAQRLGVAPATVETQISSAMRKLDARTRLAAVTRFREERGG